MCLERFFNYENINEFMYIKNCFRQAIAIKCNSIIISIEDVKKLKRKLEKIDLLNNFNKR